MTYSDDLPQISVVFIFVNEALSVILRSVHSVVNHTPSQLLKEVILVDDNSDNGELLGNLLEPGGWRTAFGMWQGHVPPEAPGEGTSCLSQLLGLMAPLVSWACGHIPPIHLHLHKPSSWCFSISPLLIWTLGFRASPLSMRFSSQDL